MSLGRNNPRHEHLLGADLLENSLAKKDLWVLVELKLTIRHYFAKKVNSILICIEEELNQEVKRYDTFSVLSTDETHLSTEYFQIVEKDGLTGASPAKGQDD